MASPKEPRALVINFAKEHRNIPALEFINTDPDGIQVEEITDNGLTNYVYRVKTPDGKRSVVLKYGEETVKDMPTETVTLDRQVIEYNSLMLMEELEPGSVPTPYCLDRKYNIIAMADMAGWDLLADQLEAGVINQDVPVHLGKLLAKVHQATSKSVVSQEKWEELIGKFRHSDLMAEIDSYTWERPYVETDEINKIPEAGLKSYRDYVVQVVQLGLNKKQKQLFHKEECFIHADLHWKSIFVKDGRAALFDFEFAFLSHPAQNVAFVVMAYYMCHVIAQNQKEERRNAESKAVLQSQFRNATKAFLISYLGDRGALSSAETIRLLTETALFIGGATFASSVFKYLENFMNVTDNERILLMHTGFKMMKLHESLTSVDKIISALFDE